MHVDGGVRRAGKADNARYDRGKNDDPTHQNTLPIFPAPGSVNQIVPFGATVTLCGAVRGARISYGVNMPLCVSRPMYPGPFPANHIA
jgi:hypothetical protein